MKVHPTQVRSELRFSLNRVFLDTLRPVASGLAVLYLLIAAAHEWTLTGVAGWVLPGLAICSSAVLLLLFFFLGKFPVPHHWAHPIGAGVAALVLVNSTLHLYLTGEPQQTTNLMLLTLGAGCLFLSLPWLLGVLGVTIVAWGLAAYSAVSSSLWLHFGFALLSSVVLSLLIFTVRLRTLQRLEQLRFQDDYQKLILKEALESAGREIVERQKAQEELKISEDRYRDLVENSGDLIGIHDLDGTVLSVNGAAVRLSGFGCAEDLIGRRVVDLLAPDVRRRFPAYLELIKTEGHAAGLMKVRTLQGETRILEYENSLRTSQSENPTVRCLGRDVTERKAAENALKRAYEEMELRVRERTAALARINHQMTLEIAERNRAEKEQQQLQEQLYHAQKLESLGVFAGGIAHDFNNLLLVIIANADLALKSLEEGTRARKNIERVAVASSRAAELTSQLLAYTGKSAREPQAVSLSDLVMETAQLLESVISKRATLKFKLENKMPMIRADAGQARQVVMNLITNAAEAMEHSDGTILVSTGTEEGDGIISEIQPRTNPRATYGYVEVTDDGCGMEPEMVAKIFDPFFTNKTTGRGLGLATVLGIVRGHQGAIRVDSKPGQGSTFRVLFPCMEQKEQTAPVPLMGLENWRGRGTILVVDDEQSVRETAQSILEEYGFNVVTARNGREGTRIVRNRSSDMVAVLLDLTMPEMNGDEALMQIRSIRKDLPVILSSGYHEESTGNLASNGSTAFIHKPYLPQDLIRKVRQVLRDRY